MSRKVQLLLGYLVQSIKRASDSEEDEGYLLELQPAERGLESQIIEADIVLWTVGAKPLLTKLEPSGPNVLPLNARGQAETDETLRVKGHPRIFALGDSSSLRDSNGKLLPTTAQVRKKLQTPPLLDHIHALELNHSDTEIKIFRLLFKKQTLLAGIYGQP